MASWGGGGSSFTSVRKVYSADCLCNFGSVTGGLKVSSRGLTPDPGP